MPDPTHHSASRSPDWWRVRLQHLQKEPACRWCGGILSLEVHHILPFHIDPEFELEPANLITLCEHPDRECHLRCGHLGVWTAYNPRIKAQCLDPYAQPPLLTAFKRKIPFNQINH